MKQVSFADDDVTDVGTVAKGAVFLFPSARTAADVGAEEGRGLRCNAEGKIIDFAVNEKCAAGAGAFTEAMGRALQVSVEEMGPLSLKSNKKIPMNAQCAVFAESEVVTLVHAKTPKEDIARAVHDAISSRIVSMIRRVGLENDMVLCGGVAYNVGFIRSMEEALDVKALVPDEPEFVSAIGAAIIAAERA
ncbi:MAG: Benzoyl CoA reductase subunit [Desulfotomaculum sp. 46_296]|nr:MAG: Benzoyl CoA reductase subunit [Desulfotomaculum sp. 46_296]